MGGVGVGSGGGGSELQIGQQGAPNNKQWRETRDSEKVESQRGVGCLMRDDRDRGSNLRHLGVVGGGAGDRSTC